jgi:hypothetical protein
MQQLTELAEATTASLRAMIRSQDSLVTNLEYSYLLDNLFLPAGIIDVPQVIVMLRLYSFNVHRLDPRHRCKTYRYKDGRLLSGWRKALGWKKAGMAQIRIGMVEDYIVDDMMIDRLAQDENVKRVLGNGLVRFRQHHWAWLDTGESIGRVWWAPESLQRSLDKLGQERDAAEAERVWDELVERGVARGKMG